MVIGCTDKSTEPPGPPTRFIGSLTLVVLTDVDSVPRGVPDIPVIVKEAHQIDPGPVTYDTVFTNQYGIAFFRTTVRCWTYETSGKLKINIGGFEAKTVYFKDGEEIDIIAKTP